MVYYEALKYIEDNLMMDHSCLYYICLLSSIHCLIVTWLVVAIETPTTENYGNASAPDNSSVKNSRTAQIFHPTETTVAGQGTTFLEKTYVTIKDNVTVQADVTTKAYITTTANVTTQTTAKSTESTVKSILDFMPACPPPDNLHQLCNVSLGNITCNERAIIVKLCYHKYTTIYSNSSWGVCVSSKDRCEDIVSFLANENLISKDAIPTTSHAYSSADVTAPSEGSHTEEVTQYPPVILTEDSKSILPDNTSAKHSKLEETTLEIEGREMTSTPISDSGSPVTLSPTISPSDSPPVADESNSHDIYPSDSLSWLYPLIGCLIILLEIILLWYFFWYRRKKYGLPPVGRYRRASTGSMVIQEDMIEPESTSPTKALYVNKEFDEDLATKEDEKIFNSYLNLRFIDDTSVEGTPKRALIK